MPRIFRRTIIKGASASVLAFPFVLNPGRAGAIAPGNRITLGLIGVGCMGRGHLHRLAGDPTVQLVAVCDVDATRRDPAKEYVDKAYGNTSCAAYNDYRQLLAREDIDAVVVVTPDHWHTPMAIHAAMAGKDVYCEKPVSMTVDEGRRLVETIRRRARVFQTGTQYRSIPSIKRICQFVRDGGLGHVKQVFTILDPVHNFIRQPRYAEYAKHFQADLERASYVPGEYLLPEEPVPPGLDWELWVGPAAWHPYNRSYHINPIPGVVPWSFCDSFGLVSNTWHLSHSADVIQYAIGMERSGPVEIIHPSSGQFPTMTFRYANGTMLHFVDHWGMVKDVYRAVPQTAKLTGLFGGVFVGERGWVTSMSSGGPVDGGPPEIFEAIGLRSREVNIGSNDHHANWFDAIRNRGRASCDEEIGHRGACVGHLATVAYRLGRSLKWDPAKEEFPGDEVANRLRSRAMRGPWTI